MPRERFSFADTLRTAAAPFALAVAAMILCRLAVGTSLGFYFAGIVIAVTMLPPMVANFDQPRHALISAFSILTAIAVVWLFSTKSVASSLAACLILFGVGMSLLAITRAARPCVGPTLAAAVATMLFIVWLSWPVWLSPWLSGSTGARIVSALAPAHPLFALNHILLDTGLWTQQSLMYQFTTLGQDVPYALPATILPCVCVHTIIALALWLPARRWEPSSPTAAT